MRLGEVLGLRWADLDLEAGTGRVAQTLQTTMEFDSPKSHRSVRTFNLPPFLIVALRRHRKAQMERRLQWGQEWHDLDLVIDRGDGAPMRPDTISASFRRTMRRGGIDLRFHGLRHGHATLMLASGADLKVISERLGHATIAITADLYTHVATETDRRASDAFDAYLTPYLNG
jgi:integrase